MTKTTHKIIAALLLGALLALPAGAADYIIGSGDRLGVSVWGVPELSVEAVVRPDGKITIPAVGDVVAADKSTTTVAADLTVEIAKLVKQPVVTVAVLEINNNKVYVTGAGVNTAVMSLSAPTTLMRLLAAVSGLERADLIEARVLRDDKIVYKGFTPLFVDGDISKDFDLEPDDIIFIPSAEAKKVYVTGAVASPRSLPWRDGLTLLDAIYASGGFSEHADKGSVLLVKKGQTPRTVSLGKVLEGEGADENLELESGDYVIVRDFTNEKIYVSGAVTTPTALIFSPGMRILDAIYAAGGFGEYASTSKVVLMRANGERLEVNLEQVVEGDSTEHNIELAPGDNVIVRESLF